MKKRERYEELLLGLGPKFSALAAACFAEQAPPPLLLLRTSPTRIFCELVGQDESSISETLTGPTRGVVSSCDALLSKKH